jgi:hypothetical protein
MAVPGSKLGLAEARQNGPNHTRSNEQRPQVRAGSRGQEDEHLPSVGEFGGFDRVAWRPA